MRARKPDRYLNYSDSDPESIATALAEQPATACDYLPVPADGAARAAGLIADLLQGHIHESLGPASAPGLLVAWRPGSEARSETMATGIPAAELLARASSRECVVPVDARSGAVFERVVVGSDRYFVKRFGFASDWIMRVSGDRVCRQYLVWQAGIMDRSPDCIDHAVVAMGVDGAGEDAVLTIVMREAGGFLVPPGDALLPTGQHGGFIAHMAALHAAFWGWDDQIGLTTMAQRILFFSPEVIAAELTAPVVPAALAAAAAGWAALPGRSPLLWRLARLVHDRPEVLTGPLAATPFTFLAGDWKLGNLGSHPDGRTILLDWAFPGAGPACWELCWYLALNRARLPEPKEAVIGRFRAALEDRGIGTGGWWQRQLDLCLIGVMATFGWEKALGDAGELSWWEARVAAAAIRQHIPIPG